MESVVSFFVLLIAGLIELQQIRFVGAASSRIHVNSEINKEVQEKWKTLDEQPTLLLGHRGEKVLMPEHTVGSYNLASIEGADYVEPDLVLTKDGFLVCYHDLIIKSGTDVHNHPEFFHLKKNFTGIIGINNVTIINDWFIQDFTLEELKTLRVVQKNVGIRPQFFNKIFSIPTFQEYLDVVHKMAGKLKRAIGIIPELKQPKFHNERWFAHYMEDKLLRQLKDNGYPIRTTDEPRCSTPFDNQSKKIECGNVVIQCFHRDTLKYLKTQTDIDLLMLVEDEVPLLTYKGLYEISKFSKYFSVWKEFLYVGVEAVLIASNRSNYDKELIASLGGFIPSHQFVPEVHRLGMKMCLYTFYDSREPSYRGCAIKCDSENKTEELFYYFRMGVDAIFVENIPEARELRLKFDNDLRLNNLKSSTASGIFDKTFISNKRVYVIIFAVLLTVFTSRGMCIN